jgi:ribosome maturation factor RimP
VDLDALANANRELSRALDELDPFPGAYTLEVSSPGLERRLRTAAHFGRAIGETVTIRTLPGTASDAARRVRGVLCAADDAGCTLEGPEVPDGSMRITYDQIERARTVFEWGSDRAAKPGKGAKREERERSRS